MKNLYFIILLLFSNAIIAQNVSISETVDYINKYLPEITGERGTLGGKIYNPRIECDQFGNITYKATFDYPDDPGKYRKEISKVFSIKDVKYIWVYDTKYTDGTFAGYQIRIEKIKLGVPIFDISISDKEIGEKICKAFLHLKQITKEDPFK